MLKGFGHCNVCERHAPLLPSTASPWRTNTATPRHSGQNWTGCSTISPWSMPRWCWEGRWSTTCRWGVTTAGWRIEPQKSRGKIANRATRVFIADFYSGNIARVHFSVRFYLNFHRVTVCFFNIPFAYRTFYAWRMHARAIFIRALFARLRVFQRKFSVNSEMSA